MYIARLLREKEKMMKYEVVLIVVREMFDGEEAKNKGSIIYRGI